MYRGHRVAVIVPAYREARLIGRTLRGIPDLVDTVHVVDDASPDGTSAAAADASDHRTKISRHEANRGVGAAIVTGYREGLASHADVLVVMAGDGQMDPRDVPALLDPIVEQRADYVKGNRFRHPEVRRMPRARRYAGKVLAAVTRHATGLDVDDSQCGFTAMSRAAADALPLRELWPRYGYPNDLLGMLAGAHLRVAEVPVRPIYSDQESGIRAWHFGVVLGVIARRWYLERRDARASALSADHGTTVPLAR